MTLFAEDPYALWRLGLACLAAAVLALFVSALWPPLHKRRLVAAFGFLIVLVSGAMAERLPHLRAPVQAVAVADCAVLENPDFAAVLAALKSGLGPLGDLRLLALPRADGGLCRPEGDALGGVRVEAASGPLLRAEALAEAARLLETGGGAFRWLRRLTQARILIAYEPGSDLAPSGSEAARVLALSDGRNAEVYAQSYGSMAMRHLRVAVWPPMLSDASQSSGVFLEMRDPRLADLEEAELVVAVAQPATGGGACVFKRQQPILFRTTRFPERLPASFTLGERGVALLQGAGDAKRLLFYRGVVFGAAPVCEGYAPWVTLRVSATARLSSGAVLKAEGLAHAPVARVGGTTLFAPQAGDPAAALATPGWGLQDPKAPDWGFDAETAPDDLLAALMAAAKSGANASSGINAPASFLPGVEGCVFSVGGGFAAARDPKIASCLERTRRLAWIAPSAAALNAAEKAYGVGDLLRAGRLEVMVAAPAYRPGEAVPAWAPEAAAAPILRAEPRLHFAENRRDVLRVVVDGASGLSAQRAFVKALGASGRLGPAAAPEVLATPPSGPFCAPGEDFPLRGSLGWFAPDPVLAPSQPPDVAAAQPGRSAPVARLRGLARVEPDPSPGRPASGESAPGDYAANFICTSPWTRLISTLRELEARGEFQPDAVIAPRAVIALFAEDDLHASLEGVAAKAGALCGFPASAPMPSAAEARKMVERWFGAGGTVHLLPVRDSGDLAADSAVAERAAGHELITLDEMVQELNALNPRHDPRNPYAARKLDVALNLAATTPEAAAVRFMAQVESGWRASPWSAALRGFSPGDGGLTDRRDVCAFELRRNRSGGYDESLGNGCAYEGGRGWATALARLRAPPERLSLLAPQADADPFLSGEQNLCGFPGSAARSYGRSAPFGLGRTTALGYSPLARDLLAADLVWPKDHEKLDSELRASQCFQQSGGALTLSTGFDPSGFANPAATPTRAHGGLSLLRRFAESAQIDRPAGAPEILAVEADPATGALSLQVAADLATPFVWAPQVEILGEDVALRTRFVAYDPRTGQARFEIDAGSARASGLLSAKLSRPVGGAADAETPALIPVDFRGLPPSQAAEIRRAGFDEPAAFLLDGGAIATLGALLGALLMFSPFARRWRVVEEAIAAMTPEARKRGPFDRVAQRAPLFSLQAAVTEWGAHAGRPAAIRSFGLPAGLRRWRSGDQGGAMRPASMFPIVARAAGLPPRIPEVALRSASEAADVLVLLEGSGALLSPRAREAPGKAEFAARFGAFLAQAARLSHGATEIRRIGLPALEALDAEETERAVLQQLRAAPDYAPPHQAVGGGAADGRLVYYICDGLSLNARFLLALAEETSADGGALRVAAVVSPDDSQAVGLRRDPQDGAFDDDSETAPASILIRRDHAIAEAAALLAQRQAQLVTLDADIDAQGLLARMDETEFLK